VGAGGNISEATKDTLVDSLYLPGAITIGTSAGFTARLGANTMAQGTVFGAKYGYLFFATKGGFLKGDSNYGTQVSTTLGCLTGGSSCPTKEGIKDITEAAEVKPFKAPPKEPLGFTMSKTVIGGALIRVGQHLVGFVYLLEPPLGPLIMVVVRMALEG
jgi:hypothetical protein